MLFFATPFLLSSVKVLNDQYNRGKLLALEQQRDELTNLSNRQLLNLKEDLSARYGRDVQAVSNKTQDLTRKVLDTLMTYVL